LNKTIGLLLDYTKSMKRELKLEFLDYFVKYDYTSFIILYGIRAYPLCELNCKRLVRLDYYSIPTLDGPPEPYRAVKEAVELINTYGLKNQTLVLVWSAPRKPLVDIQIAFNYALNSMINLYLIVIDPHSARWLTKALQPLDEDKIIYVKRQLNIQRLLERIS